MALTQLKTYRNELSRKERRLRALWTVLWVLFATWLPRCSFGSNVRNGLARLFGAKIGKYSYLNPFVKIWAPWNLTMGDFSALAPGVECYSVDKVVIGDHVTISQGAYLCTASHDIRSAGFELITSPIRVESNSWIAARATVLQGVTIGEGAVVAANAVVTKDVEPWTVVGGNQAKFIKKRDLKV